MAVTVTKLSLAEFLALPETEPASELIDGEVVQKPMPTFEHGFIQSALSFVLNLFLRSEPIGFIGTARLRQTGPGQPFRGAPDLAVEILSPDDRPDRVAAKVAFYLLHGVRLVWLIDPETRTVTVLTADGRSMRLSEEATLDGDTVLPGFAVAVRDILPPALTGGG